MDPAAERYQCGYCFSANVRIVASEENRDVMIIRCERCGKTSELDVENPQTPLNDPAKRAALPRELAE